MAEKDLRKAEKLYKAMQKKHRKERVKLAKESADFDWSYLHNYVKTFVLHMYEFYDAGLCLFQAEEERLKTLSSLQKAKELIDKMESVFKPYYETLELLTDEQLTEFMASDKWDKVTAELAEEKEKLFVEFYRYIGEHMKEWWD